MAVPYTFGTATAAIPLSQLDSNFATAITLGNTAMYLGNTTTSVGNLTLTNVTISSGTANVTANITYGTANAVVYSNASNVGTTSANLTFNGTTLTSTGFAGPLNGTVGATTPAAGSFTTTTIGTSETLSYGTANGVAYLNGSKVVTSGSALTFDGSILTNTTGAIRASGATVPSAGAGLELLYGASGAGISTLLSYDRGASTYKPMWFDGSYQAYFVSGSEKMRLDPSGNLGLGVTPTTWTNGRAIQISGTNYGLLSLEATNATSTFRNWAVASNYNNSGELNFVVGTSQGAAPSSVVATIDSSGNLGLGVTPSAWTTLKPIQFAGGASLAGFSNTGYLGANCYFDGSWRYIATGTTGRYEVAADHKWFSAASGTAGNAITFTQALTLNASGNLLLGQTSGFGANGGKMEIYASDNFNGAPNLALNVGANNTGGIYLYFTNADGTKIGSVTQASSSGVLYNVTSDKRLKNDLGVVSNTNVIANTVIHDFTWKEDGIQERGVFAQEAVNVLPSAIYVGDNNEDVTNPWAVDYSKYIPDIIVELQALRARVAELEAK